MAPRTGKATSAFGPWRSARSVSSTATSAPARSTRFAKPCKPRPSTARRGPEAVLGILSLIVWTLLLIVTLKYVLVLLRADNKGEGGTFALMALGQSVAKRSAPLILVLGVVGASFFYGDAVITPAISVLSAVEGLKLVAPHVREAVVPADHGRHPGRAVCRAVARHRRRWRASSARSCSSGSSRWPSAA